MLTRKKQYPENYPSDAVAILNAMSFTDGRGIRIVGSMSLRSQQYAGDYDAVEYVELDESTDDKALNKLVSKFKTIVERLEKMDDVFVGDIKSGVIEEWRILPKMAHIKNGKVIGYSAEASRNKVDQLLKDGVLSLKEAKDSKALLKTHLTPEEFVIIKGILKFHLVRWSVSDVMAGKKTLRDGRTYTLKEAFHSPTITKLDVIGMVQNNRYTDFSCIYEFKNDGQILNPDRIDVAESLRENIILYRAKGDHFKVLKREFALAKYLGDTKRVQDLTVVLNSDLGRLYQISGDIGTLLALLEDHKGVSLSKIRFEVDQFRARLANIYMLKGYLKVEPVVLDEIDKATRSPNRKLLYSRLKVIKSHLDRQLQSSSENGRWNKR